MSVEGWVRPEVMKRCKSMAPPEGEEGDMALEVQEDMEEVEGEEEGLYPQEIDEVEEDMEEVEGEEEGLYPQEIDEMGGIRMVGGVSFINLQTALFCDLPLRRILNSDERWQAYLQYREEAFRIAASELVSSYGSPVDLINFTDADRQEFLSQCFDYIMACRDHSIIGNGTSSGCAVDKISKKIHLTENDIQHHSNNKRELLQGTIQIQRYFAYRKGLLKLDFVQSNSDPEYVLKRLRSSNLWSELSHHERRLGLESHLNLLKELEKTKSGSLSECENLALEKINLELGSELQKHLDDSDWTLMNQYYNRKKLMNLARECVTQSEATGYILCEQALPLPSRVQIAANPEVKNIKPTVKLILEGVLTKRLPYIKQTVKQSRERPMRLLSEKLQSSIAHGKAWQLKLACAVTAVTLATASDSIRR